MSDDAWKVGYDAWKTRSPYDDWEVVDDRDKFDPDGPIAEEECGRWRNTKLAPVSECLSAGTEFCQIECPLRGAAP